MKILFTFENVLPSAEADAEVFISTARHLAPSLSGSWLHVPASRDADGTAIAALAGMPVVRAYAPVRPAALRHIFCGLTLVVRKEFRQADLVYTRNLWVAWLAVLFGQTVVFDHYRPWPDQIPPLQPLIYRLMCNRRFLVNICHSDYTRGKYRELGVPERKLVRVWNGYEPRSLQPFVSSEVAKRSIGVPAGRKIAVYTGRINHKKGLDLVVEAARRLADITFILVGSYGDGPIETMAKSVSNIRLVPWQPPETLRQYIFAADVLLIPPSWRPLAEHGSTVLPLKLFFYMASGRPILAGQTSDVMELLKHQENAFLCRPDCVASLVAGLEALTSDTRLASRLAAQALSDSRDLTWGIRARNIATVIGNRLQAASTEHGTGDGLQAGVWMRRSGRWLVHLIRRRSWILPPDLGQPEAAIAGAEAAAVCLPR